MDEKWKTMGDIENNSENTDDHLPYFLVLKKNIFIAMCAPREGLKNIFTLAKQRAKKNQEEDNLVKKNKKH